MVREVRNYCFELPVCFPPLFLKKFQGKACGEKIVRTGWYRGPTMMMKLSIVGQGNDFSVESHWKSRDARPVTKFSHVQEVP